MYEERRYKKEAKKKTKGFIKTREFKILEEFIFLKRYKSNKTVTVRRMKKLIYFFNLQVLKFFSECKLVFSEFHDKPSQSSHQEVPFQ